MTVTHSRIERGVAPLWAEDGSARRLLGPCTIVTSRSGETLGLALTSVVTRADDARLLVGTDLGGGVVSVVRQHLSRFVACTVLVLARWRWPTDDVSPIAIDRASGFRHAPFASHVAIALEQRETTCHRRTIELALREHTFATRGGSGDDVTSLLASTDAAPPSSWLVEGAPVIARHPASRVLGTPAEERLLALALPRRRSPNDVDDAWAELVPIETA